MESPEPVPFTPVPVRGRRDGWSAERQRGFIAFLAQGFRPGRAARMVGMSRQTAYALREREGAESFAVAWDEAVGAARRRRSALRPPTEWERAVEGVVRPVRYRGRIVGHERRYDVAALVRILGRLANSAGNGKSGGKVFSPHDAELLSAFGPPLPWLDPVTRPAAAPRGGASGGAGAAGSGRCAPSRRHNPDRRGPRPDGAPRSARANNRCR